MTLLENFFVTILDLFSGKREYVRTCSLLPNKGVKFHPKSASYALIREVLCSYLIWKKGVSAM